MSLASIVCWMVFVFILFSIDPFETNWPGFALFYFSLGLSLAGTFSLAGFLIRFNILKKDLVFKQVAEAFRQSFLVSLLLIAILILLAKGLFTWMNLFLLVLGVFLLEYFWASRQSPRMKSE